MAGWEPPGRRGNRTLLLVYSLIVRLWCEGVLLCGMISVKLMMILDEADVPVFILCMSVARAILVVAKSAGPHAATGIFSGCITAIAGTPNEAFPRPDIVAIMGRLAGHFDSKRNQWA